MKRLIGALVVVTFLSSPVMVSASNGLSARKLAVEKGKWQYLRSKIGVDLSAQEGLISKLGGLMKNYAFLWAMPFGCGGSVLGGGVGLSGDLFSLFSRGSGRSNFGLGASCGIAIGCVAGYLSSYAFNRIVGGWLEAKPLHCRKALATFLSQWERHCKYVPNSVRPFFEELYDDLDKSKNQFKTLDDEQARLLLENIIATSLIVQALA